ncbi:multiprotein-bridging factor 1 family protein [Streptomyces sp. NBC_00057]|uniref:helix-turn-helix domain-containing protein n=1 Tax=Streptomyces sp. NBC_00057 TaxID=2975634 RepID=UPI0038679141
MYAPVRRKGIDDDQPPASFNGFPARSGEAFAARVRDLDPQPSAREEGESETEPPPVQPPVHDRVSRRFGDDERAGLTQREVGDRLGYSEDLIRSLERERRTPQPEFLDAADNLSARSLTSPCSAGPWVGRTYAKGS